MGGEAAWVGGVDAIERAAPKDIILCFAQRRLEAVSRVVAVKDPSRVLDLNLEATLLATEQLAPSPALCYDNMALRGLFMKHCGLLSADQANNVSVWQNSPSGQWVGKHLRAVLKT